MAIQQLILCVQQVHLGYQWAESVHDRILQAVLQGAKTQCSVCGLMGATLRCKTAGCTLKFHLPCAIDADCHLFVITFLPSALLLPLLHEQLHACA